MKRFYLGSTDIQVSSLGFGCVQLTAHQNTNEAVGILEHAYQCGITHFDVARSYGFGRCEGILGKFLKGKRGNVTVTTKFGFDMPKLVSSSPYLVTLAKKVLKPFPKVLSHVKKRGSSLSVKSNFTAEGAIASIDKSLQELQTDYIDILLLHEASVENANSEELILALMELIKVGKVRAVGIGSDFNRVREKLGALDQRYSALQFNNNVIEQNLPLEQSLSRRGIITHSAFKHYSMLLKKLQENEGLAKIHSQKLGFNLLDPNVLSKLLLSYAYHSNPNGMILFASKRPLAIVQNIETIASPLPVSTTKEFLTFCDDLVGLKIPVEEVSIMQ